MDKNIKRFNMSQTVQMTTNTDKYIINITSDVIKTEISSGLRVWILGEVLGLNVSHNKNASYNSWAQLGKSVLYTPGKVTFCLCRGNA